MSQYGEESDEEDGHLGGGLVLSDVDSSSDVSDAESENSDDEEEEKEDSDEQAEDEALSGGATSPADSAGVEDAKNAPAENRPARRTDTPASHDMDIDSTDGELGSSGRI